LESDADAVIWQIVLTVLITGILSKKKIALAVYWDYLHMVTLAGMIVNGRRVCRPGQPTVAAARADTDARMLCWPPLLNGPALLPVQSLMINLG